MLSGVIPILATPFTRNDDIDVDGLERLTAFVLASGVTAVATLGLASEAFALSPSERSTVVRAVRHAAGAQVHLVVGVAATSLRGAFEQGAAAINSGADSLMALPPYLVKPDERGIRAFYRQLGEAFGRVMVQDAPTTTGVELEPSLIAELSDLPGVTSFKIETPHSALKMREVRRLVPDAPLLGGRNAVAMLDELAAGSIGTMPACEFTGTLRQVDLQWRAGGSPTRAYSRLEPLLAMGIRPRKGWAVHKYVLRRMGIIGHGGVRHPAEPLSLAETDELESLLAAWQSGGDTDADHQS